MIRINNLRLEIGEDITRELLSKKYKIPSDDVISFKLLKKSVDARKKSDIHYNCSLALDVKNEKKYLNNKDISVYENKSFELPKTECCIDKAVVVGSGPAGLFCALVLANCGIEPLVIERGYDVDKRIDAVNAFWEKGEFCPRCNVQFGEGGAGTFSDGKLTCGVNDERLQYIKEQFVKFGAPEEILYLSKPHIGTDKLIETVKNIRNEIIRLGGSFEFNTRLSQIVIENGKIVGAKIEKDGNETFLECENIILAIGHSARDTFRMLKDMGIKMEKKAFSIGARIEHMQEKIGYSQYGEKYTELPAADYKLAVKTKDGRGVYTFCMCPGGVVVASASEDDTVVTNGMSYYKRDGKNANSAILVTVLPEDIKDEDVLGGIHLQREIEKKAFKIAGGNYFAPVQLVGDFLENKESKEFGNVVPTYKPGTRFCNLEEIFPKFITDAMRQALPLMDKKLKGFADFDAVLTAPETRSSSPVRILRDETLQSNISGLYPCGEGAGYAGGIMSAALDGIRCALALMDNNQK